MKIKIRLATLSDLNKLMGIFDTARRFMQSTGNANQWINGYPQRELIMHEINSGHCYVCINEQESGNHSIFRHDNFIGCFSADKIKMSARK